MGRRVRGQKVENNFTSIPNDFLEALSRIRIRGESMQILLFIIRKTFGWHKKEDAISLSQFILGTGITKPSVSRALKHLESMNLIFINKTAKGMTHKYKINTDFETWIPLTKKQKGDTNLLKGVRKNVNKLSAKKRNTKEINKNTKEREIRSCSY